MRHPSPLRAEYERDGFLVLRDFVSKDACRALIDRAGQILRDFDPEAHRSVFSTHEQTRTSDEYFLESGEAVRCFFEEEAFDENRQLRQEKALSVNKIGHALHDLDPIFDRFSRTPALAQLTAELGMRAPRLLQSMYICKQPRIGGEVSSHQDATFLYTDPMTVMGLWFALEDATLENGCLWAKRGGHLQPLRKRFVRDPAGGTRFTTLDETPFDEKALTPLEVPAGTLIVLHGLLPHRSDANRSPRSRHAYSVHLVEADAHYPADNWLQRPTLKPRGFAD